MVSEQVVRALVRNILHVQGGSTHLLSLSYTYIASGRQSSPLAGQDVSSTLDNSLSPPTTLQTFSKPSIARAYRYPFGHSHCVIIIAVLPSLPFVVIPITNKSFYNKNSTIVHHRL